MLCQHAGIADRTIANSAAYIQAWLKQLQNNKSWIFTAAGRAQKGVDYVLGVKSEESKEGAELTCV
ncbi:zincin-like metallopeptidase domain-containing protein [Thermoanaerobacter sp. YS13]|uniref:zincin-like metallopeptidase domain-containing protein n=1 Tax=Thermoanaerobacter sp. YS13 TaxID=1511746 RepID=UPI00068D2374